MLKSLHIRDVGPLTELNIDFASRLNLFTGDNGLGKSFLLDIAWWVQTGTWPGLVAMPKTGASVEPLIEAELEGVNRLPRANMERITSREQFVFQPYEARWTLARSGNHTGWVRGPGGGFPIPADTLPRAPVLYTRIDGGVSVWDSCRNLPETPGYSPLSAHSAHPPEAYHFTQDTLWNGLEISGKPVCNGLLQDWVSWQQGADEADRETFSMLSRALEVLSAPDTPLRPGKPVRMLGDARRIPTLELPYGTTPLLHVSAGMRRILSLAYALVWTWSEHLIACQLLNVAPAKSMVLIIDEVESHLHPQWQRSILNALIKIVESLTEEADMSTQLLVVTHAPLILASVEPWFDEAQDSLWTFDLEDRAITLKQVPFVRRGKADLWLTSDFFDLKEARSKEAEDAIGQARALLSTSNPAPADVARVDAALRATLSDIDGFWTRWRYWVESQKVAQPEANG